MDILQLIKVPDTKLERFQSGISGFDNLLGGGFVAGETLILAGEPGSGKSTLLMQVANGLAKNNFPVLYVCGEESLSQVKARSNRLNVENPEIWVSESINLEKLYQSLEKSNQKLIIIDSLQMLYSDLKKQDPGSPTQMRYCLRSLIQYAKDNDKILIVVGHSTKTGLIAGLLTLQHMVDALLFLTIDDTDKSRIVSVKKNRFGAAQESWKIQMTEHGLTDNPWGIPKMQGYKEIKVPYQAIREVIDRTGALNRYGTNGTLKWLTSQLLGRNLTSSEQFDIIFLIKKELG